MMTAPVVKFQMLLRELFQFDCADLDFGIYRIMNYKRDVIEKFITQDLPKAIAEELDRGALADQSQAAKELKEVAEQIAQALGKEALDADGNLAEAYHGTPLGKKYMDLKAKAAGGRSREALEASIFNHLYTFFSRYYQDGDFISKRRYSRRQRYAIPYNGEEVYLYWANNDQYYVKTAEHFHDYSFSSRGVTVHFKLQAASIEQNNVKGNKRFFLPRVKETEWDQDTGQLVIPFEYRPLTGQEEISYGKKNQQDVIIAEALTEIPKRLKKADKALVALTSERHRNSDGQPVTFLEHHLRQYTRRNTSDFFIHKDLRGFLSRELDFYLKNEVLNLDEVESAGEDLAEGWFQLMRVIKAVGGRIIDFLDQIECFQKMLWEKRKFITETQYCITVGNIDETFYPDIAACEPQWAEYKDMFHIDEEQTALFSAGKSKKDKRIAFLKAHPTLVLDTKHFDQDFVDRLLGSFSDLDKLTDGLLVHSENFQALNLLVEKYREKVKCIYIDPPYNTGTGDFLYKDAYQHSSWLAMMDERICRGHALLRSDGHFVCHIDEHEVNALEELIRLRFGRGNSIGPVIWDKRNPKGDATGIATQHEYLLWAVKDAQTLRSEGGVLHRKKKNVESMLTKAEYLIRQTGEVNEKVRHQYKQWLSTQPFTVGEKAYCEIDDSGNVYRPVSMAWPNKKKAPDDYFEPVIHPVTKKPCPVPKRGWRYPSQTMQKLIDDGQVLFGNDETTQPNRKYILKENLMENVPSLLYYGGSDDALQERFGYFFENPKPVVVGESVASATIRSHDGLLLDYFAGSATSAHALINLAREDGLVRAFCMVEMADYFDTVLLPRIKKVTFTPEWKDGKPKRMATQEEAERSPRIVKYIRIEGYEDALNNIEFDEAFGQQALKFDDYLLKYMLKWETRKSETLLNVENLAQPFSYKLHIHADGQTREKVADIPETFNYLLGLHVQTRKVYDDDGRRYLVYRGRIDHRRIVVIWRETEGWQKADLERDKKFVAEQKLTEGADEVFVNGDSFIPNAKALEPMFKARMFAEVQA